MKKIKSLKEFEVGKKYLFTCLGNKSIGIATHIEKGFVNFKIYQSTYNELSPGTVCHVDESSFKDGKSYLLTENEFRVEIL